MSEFRDRLAEAIRSVTDKWDEPLDEVHDVPQIVDALIAAGVVADPTELAVEHTEVLRLKGILAKKPNDLENERDEALAELAELRKYVAGVKNAHTTRQADAWDAAVEFVNARMGGQVATPDENPYRRAEPETTP